MGELSSRLKTCLTIFSPNFASKSGFGTSLKIFESTSSAKIGLPNAQQAQILFLVKTIKCKN
jgi:hypothetical protein